MLINCKFSALGLWYDFRGIDDSNQNKQILYGDLTWASRI